MAVNNDPVRSLSGTITAADLCARVGRWGEAEAALVAALSEVRRRKADSNRGGSR